MAYENIEQRTARVFISSTFRDMSVEREELVKYIFPELQRRLNRRHASVVGVDLRWGITPEEAERGDVLSVCMEEVDRSVPYFICLLGDRYGWIPDRIDEKAISKFPWLRVFTGKSITELEIYHGVLSRSDKNIRVFFYFRKPELSAAVERELAKSPGYQPESPDAALKLQDLKEQIRQSGYPVRVDYPDAKTVGEWIVNDLWEAFDKDFPEGLVPSALDLHRLEHNAFAAARTKVYVGGTEYFRTIDSHIENGGGPLVIIGESGSGKSALVSNWATRFKAVNPDTFLLLHFIGATPDSADYVLLLRRMIEEIRAGLTALDGAAQDSPEAGSEIPSDPEKLIEAFPRWLAKTERLGSFVLVIDALNQLADRDNAPDLRWLPEHFPENVRLIVSTLPGRSMDAVERRGWKKMPVKPLTIDEINRFIVDHLGRYGKKLGESQIRRISGSRQAANPLFLRSLLEELRIFGTFEELDSHISHYLQAETIDALFAKILGRLEHDYERELPGLVRRVMSLLWASRNGLAENELLEMLGSESAPMPQAYWSPLYLALLESLVNRSGLLAFFHDFLRQAVESRYLGSKEEAADAHFAIAAYFDKKELSERKITELPWQYAQIDAWDRLYANMSNLDFFALMMDKDQFEAKSFWTLLESKGGHNMIVAYRNVIDAPEQYPDHVWHVSSLFTDTGRLAEAYPLLEFLVGHYRSSGDLKNLSGSLGNLANILYARGDLDGAMELYQEAEKICVQLEENDGIQRAVGNQALILQTRGALAEAMALYEKKEKICREIGNKDGLQRALGNRAVIYQTLGELDKAMALFMEKERLCRETGDKNELPLALGNQAVILQTQGKYAESLELHKMAEKISRDIGNKDGLQRSLTNQAALHVETGDLQAAIHLADKAVGICRETGNIDGLQYALGVRAMIHMELGQHDASMESAAEKERLCRQMGNMYELHRAIGTKAAILTVLGKLAEADGLYAEEAGICREIGNQGDLLIVLDNYASLKKQLEEPDGALGLYNEAERICRTTRDYKFLAEILRKSAAVNIEEERLDDALTALKESVTLAENINDAAGLRQSYSELATVYRRLERPDDAIIALINEDKICRRNGYWENLHSCLGAQALVRQGMGDTEAAIDLFRGKEAICRERGFREGLCVALVNQAALSIKLKKPPAGILPLVNEANAIAENDGLKRLTKQIMPIREFLKSRIG